MTKKETLEARNFSREELDRLCYPVFKRLLAELGDRYEGWIVVIEPSTGEYFMGLDDFEVLNRARKRHPHALFFAYRLNEESAVDRLC